MYFSINAFHYLVGADDTYRLKKDGSWQKQDEYKAFDIENDMLFNNIHDAQNWLNTKKYVVVNEHTVEVDPETVFASDTDRYDIEIICHRESCPKHMFTFDEFKNAIANADDSYDNSLQITFDGEVIARPLKEGEIPNRLYDFAVREETFLAGNGYVGHNDIDDFYESLFHSLLDGWLWHLTSGRSVYQGEEYPEISKEDILKEISNIYSKYSNQL